MHKADFLFAVLLAACGSGDDTVDSGLDAIAPTDATMDTSSKDSGKDSAADAGTDTGAGDDADAEVDAGLDVSVPDGGGTDSGCGSKLGSGSGSSDGGCTIGESWTCGANNYDITCQCPGNVCNCKKNGSSISAPYPYTGCPSCSSPTFATIAVACGIPY